MRNIAGMAISTSQGLAAHPKWTSGEADVRGSMSWRCHRQQLAGIGDGKPASSELKLTN